MFGFPVVPAAAIGNKTVIVAGFHRGTGVSRSLLFQVFRHQGMHIVPDIKAEIVACGAYLASRGDQATAAAGGYLGNLPEQRDGVRGTPCPEREADLAGQ